MARLSLRLLGNLQVRLADKILQSFGTEKVRALLAYLVIESERSHTRTFLSGMLWPDQNERLAQHNFRQALSTLRKLLPEDSEGQPFVIVNTDSIRFNCASDFETDLDQFHYLMDKGMPGQGRLHAASLYVALDLYSEPLLGQFDLSDSNIFSEWLFLQREHCDRRAIQALVKLVEFHKRRMEIDLAYDAAERLVHLAPWDESAHLEAIRLLAQRGEFSLAMARFESMRRQLQELLDLAPSPAAEKLMQLVRQSAGEQKPFMTDYLSPTHNIQLPATPFYGRQRELETIQTCLSDPTTRLITLLGVGGIGKSRLALQVAHSQIGQFTNGVWHINLTNESLLERINQVLQIHPSAQFSAIEQAIQFLRTKKILLVLDSFEHVRSEASALGKLLESAPGLVVIVTSRQRLNLQIEHVFPLDGLEIPPASITNMVEAKEYSASALLLAHSARVRPAENLHVQDFHAIAEICHLLNGLPLGLELAAAAAWGSSLQAIASELRKNLDFINTRCEDVAPRHRSLRAAFYSSWDMLNDDQKRALARLGVFQSSFISGHATQITNRTASILVELLDRSLLRQTSNGRVEIPEPIYPYVCEILSEDPHEALELAKQHAEFYTSLYTAQASQLSGRNMSEALKVMNPELANCIQAWQWAIQQKDESLIYRLLNPLHSLLHIRSEFTRSIRLLEPAVSMMGEHSLDVGLLSALLFRLGSDYLRLGWTARAEQTLRRGLDLLPEQASAAERTFGLDALATCCHKQALQEEARQLANQALVLSRKHNDVHGQKNALYLLAEIEFRLGNLPSARELMEETLKVARKTENSLAILLPLSSLGDYACYQEEYRIALRNFEECLEIAIQIGSNFHQAIQHNNIGTVQHMLASYPAAVENYQSSLALCRQIGYLEGEALALGNLGEIMVIQLDYTRATDYYEHSLAIARQIENPRTIAVALNNLGETYRNMGNLEKAGHYFYAGLQVAWEKQVISQVLESLTGLGILLLGRTDPALGMTCLKLVCSHPSSEPDDRLRAQQALRDTTDCEVPATSLEEIVGVLLRDVAFSNSQTGAGLTSKMVP